MKAMIFDCERLKRVLEEEKRYFKELCNSEEKSHAQRLKELESIKRNLREEEDTSTCSIRLSKLHIGLMKLGPLLQSEHIFSLASQFLMHSIWNLCPQGVSCVTVSPFSIGQMQTVHWSSSDSSKTCAGNFSKISRGNPLLTLPIFSSSSKSSS